MLLIRGLLTDKSQRIEEDLQIPFFVTDSKAKVPAGVRVESMTRLRVQDLRTERLATDRRPPGKYIEVMKTSNRKTGAPVELAFDETGRRVEPQRIFQRILENRVRKFGKLHETLHARLQKTGSKTRIPVVLWLQCEEALETGEKNVKGPTARPTKEDTRAPQGDCRTSTRLRADNWSDFTGNGVSVPTRLRRSSMPS